jgi:N-methylhydantoinase A
MDRLRLTLPNANDAKTDRLLSRNGGTISHRNKQEAPEQGHQGDTRMYLGVEIGGTFTDLVLMDEDGAITTIKALTTPGELEKGVLDAMSLVAEDCKISVDGLLQKIKAFGHGTTQATNALIERKGACTGLITTRGFGDTLLLQRLMGFTAGLAPEKIGWFSRRGYPDPIVPRHLIEVVPERIDQAGNVLLPLDEEATRRAIDALVAKGAQVFAVCLLWSFRNPSHERRVAELIAERAPGAYVTLSSDIAPVIGEYERTATTVLNSYLAPRVSHYLNSVEGVLRQRGLAGTFHILNSIGGVMPVDQAARRPVLLLTSGPTGGVIGSQYLAKSLGHRNVITTDMGGTSFDVGLIIDGKPQVSSTHEVGRYHVATPTVDIRAIGAGGGSIARVRDGLIEVGPDSASAYPGPVCYGRGGEQVTVTDADVVLGIIDPGNFLGGRMKLDLEAAKRAIERDIAAPLGMTVEEAAAGVRRVVDSHMADTLREVTIGRGHDPRDFVLYAYGGAGPVHCASYGAELGVQRIVVPATSTVHSAYGAVASDIHQTFERSLLLRGGGGDLPPWQGLDPQLIQSMLDELAESCLLALEAAGVARTHAILRRSVDLRYRRQTHSLITPIPAGPITIQVLRGVLEDFERAYEGNYGRGAAFREAGIETTIFRVEAIGQTHKPEPKLSALAGMAVAKHRKLYDPAVGRQVTAQIIDWRRLAEGKRIDGPAVIEDPATAVLVSTGQVASVDSARNIVIEGR